MCQAAIHAGKNGGCSGRAGQLLAKRVVEGRERAETFFGIKAKRNGQNGTCS